MSLPESYPIPGNDSHVLCFVGNFKVERANMFHIAVSTPLPLPVSGEDFG